MPSRLYSKNFAEALKKNEEKCNLKVFMRLRAFSDVSAPSTKVENADMKKNVIQAFLRILRAFCVRVFHHGVRCPSVRVFHLTKLFGESKCLLANRENFFPYEQALSDIQARFKPTFHLANLFARTDKKVGTAPICSQRIFSPANFNQSRCRILVFASRRANSIFVASNAIGDLH